MTTVSGSASDHQAQGIDLQLTRSHDSVPLILHIWEDRFRHENNGLLRQRTGGSMYLNLTITTSVGGMGPA